MDNPFPALLKELDNGKHWAKGSFISAERRYCLLGVVRYSGILPEIQDRVKVNRMIREIIQDEYNLPDIPLFNDLVSTTWTDVERVLEKASAKWDELYS